MNSVARSRENTSIVCAGWDPGTVSVNRVLMDAYLPGAKPQEFYGLTEKGGLSQGHSDAVRTIEGVKDAQTAKAYLDLAREILGEEWVYANHFLFGAANLISSIFC